jgi:hypothetical protein
MLSVSLERLQYIVSFKDKFSEMHIFIYYILYTYIYIYVYTHTHTHTHTCMNTYLVFEACYICTHTHTNKSVVKGQLLTEYTHTYTHTCTLYVIMYIYTHVCINLCICLYMTDSWICSLARDLVIRFSGKVV